MVKDEALTVKDAVHKLQLFLLEGIRHENQLLAAGSLISQSDYQDVVTERTIVNMCGYPLCSNSLPNERSWKGNYHISLKEHKVYDLQETYMYCSNGCLINSRAFVGSLEEERCSALSPAKLNEVLKLFEVLSKDSAMDMGKNGELGLTELKILEKKDAEFGEVSLEEWIGPANAIEGYVPRRYWSSKPPQPNNLNGVKHELDDADIITNYLNFTSTIITQDEYCISKTVPPVKAEKPKEKVGRKEVNDQSGPMRKPSTRSGSIGEARSKMFHKENIAATTADQLKVSENAPRPSQNNQNRNATKGGNHLGKESKGGTAVLKSSLKTSDSKKATRSVTWADEKTDADGLNNEECIEFEYSKGAVAEPFSLGKEVDEDSYRFASAEACARALSEAAEAVASGKSHSSVAFSEADLIIRPPPHGMTEAKSLENGDVTDTDISILKWPAKQGISNDDPFDSENSWYDSPPEGFSLTLSPFSMMFMALFTWISSSSLAYIYGRDESYHEDYLSVNGREYPRKIFMPDGRSSEIKLTMAGCLSRALPGLVTVLRLPTPVSTLEQGMGHLLDTMSFLDSLPPFRMKQWQVIVFLFLDALSVSQIPALTPYIMDRRILLPKVLEGAQISFEEFEIMKGVIMPLGRVPQLSTQSGG